VKGLPLVDMRRTLPGDVAGWPRRRTSQVHGLVVHHTANHTAGVISTARWHIEERKWPGLSYHFWVEPSGSVIWANDMQSATYSQGGAGSSSPVPYSTSNKNFVSVVLRGNFVDKRPSDAQRTALRWLWAGVRDSLNLRPDMLLTHGQFKSSTACPGRVREVVEEILTDVPRVHQYMPEGARDFQRLLVGFGKHIGRSGPLKDGVDGIWGARSTAALTKLIGTNSGPNFDSSYRLAQKVEESKRAAG